MKKRNGYVLPAVIMFIIVSIVMGMAVLELGTFENIESVRRLNREKAFYLAEAGVEKAKAVYRAYPDHSFLHDYDEDNPYDELKTGEIILCYDPEDKIITSTGRVGPESNPVTKTIEFTLEITELDTKNLPSGFIYLDSEHFGPHTSFHRVSEFGALEEVEKEDVVVQGDRWDYPDEIQMPPGEWSGKGFSEYADEEGDLFVEEDMSLTGDHKFRTLRVKNNVTLTLKDGARVFVDNDIDSEDGDIHLPQQASIVIEEVEDPEGVEIYLGGSVNESWGGVRAQLVGDIITESKRPADLRIYSNSTNEIKFPSDSDFYGVVYAPDSIADMVAHTNFHGALVVSELRGNPHTTLNLHDYLSELGGVPVMKTLREARWSKQGWSRLKN